MMVGVWLGVPNMIRRISTPAATSHCQHSQKALLVHAAPVPLLAKGEAHHGFGHDRAQQNSEHQRQRLEEQVQHPETPALDERYPALVRVPDLLYVLNPAIQLGQRLALVGKTMQTRHHRRGVCFGLVVTGGSPPPQAPAFVRPSPPGPCVPTRAPRPCPSAFCLASCSCACRALSVHQADNCPPSVTVLMASGTRHRYRLLLGRGMLLRRLLQLAPLVAALPCEVEPRVFQLVLIERELRLCQLELRRRLIARIARPFPISRFARGAPQSVR